MATAFNISRLLAAGAARGAPRAASVGSRNLLPASTFGASLPGGRQLGDGRVFAFPNGNGSGARGAHTATAAAPRGGSSSASGSSPSGGAKSHATHGAHETKAKEKSGSVPSELVFEPFEEVAGALEEVRSSEGHDVSLAREASYTAELEEAVNAQISVELTISHIYHSMYAYFDRDNVSLRGLAAYFLKQSDGERRHAENFMQFQNRRGGRVRLTQLPMPMSDFDHAEKGDALNAMEMALSLEKLNYQKLMHLDKLAVEAEDFNLADYVDEMIDDQTKDVKRAADYVSQLRRVGKGHGTWDWDQELYDEYH